MKKLRLKNSVTIEGPDCFGRKAWITFHPTVEAGWHWTPYPKHQFVVPIDWRIAGHLVSPGLLYIQYQDTRLYIVEHLLSLRFTGLDGIRIEGSKWPPYHARPLEIWQALQPELAGTSEDVTWISPKGEASWKYTNGRSGFVSLEPGSRSCLTVDVTINYPGLGEKTVLKFFPDHNPAVFENILSARAPGWPRWRYPLCLVGSKFGWPHFHSICWPQRLSCEDTLREFVLHRVGDLLGGLALASATALLSGRAISHCAGHAADLGLLRQCNFKLQR